MRTASSSRRSCFPSVFLQFNVAWGEVMAYLSIITVPVLVFYLFLQRAFISSIAATGLKG
jgi:multiple sugar transport system permease protein